MICILTFLTLSNNNITANVRILKKKENFLALNLDVLKRIFFSCMV